MHISSNTHILEAVFPNIHFRNNIMHFVHYFPNVLVSLIYVYITAHLPLKHTLFTFFIQRSANFEVQLFFNRLLF